MLSITNVVPNLTRVAGRTALIAKKYSPEVSLVVGIGMIIGGTVTLCKTTMTKAEAIKEEYNDRMSMVDEVYNNRESYEDENGDAVEYTNEDYKKDICIIKLQTAVQYVKTYAPGVLLMVGGIACILASYGIMRKRNVALTIAYNGLNEAFLKYRARVAERIGEQEEDDIYHGVSRVKEIKTVVGEDGKKKKVEEEKIVATNTDGISPYARFFDESNRYYSKSPGENSMFLRKIQNWANDKLLANGHLFLNDVYRMLDIPDSSAGAIVGWVVGNGDGFVDFGLYGDRNIDFINGYERTVLLDFNVDGIIYDLI